MECKNWPRLAGPVQFTSQTQRKDNKIKILKNPTKLFEGVLNLSAIFPFVRQQWEGSLSQDLASECIDSTKA